MKSRPQAETSPSQRKRKPRLTGSLPAGACVGQPYFADLLESEKTCGSSLLASRDKKDYMPYLRRPTEATSRAIAVDNTDMPTNAYGVSSK